MKTMTCKQLGGACEVAFHANTFEEMAAMSKKHAMEMFQKNDAAHLDAMKEMQNMMASPTAMSDWMEMKRKEFNQLPENK